MLGCWMIDVWLLDDCYMMLIAWHWGVCSWHLVVGWLLLGIIVCR